MIKILHTADWHLGQTFFGYDRDEEHEAFLIWLSEILTEKEIDVLLIAGDIFDVANPSAAAQYRFYYFLRQFISHNPRLQIVIVAGNHDSAARLEAPLPLLEEMNTHIVGIVERKQDGSIDFDKLLLPLYDREGNRQAWCMAVPFLRQGDYPPSDKENDTYVTGVGRMYKQLYKYAVTKKNAGQAILAMGHLHACGAELSEDDPSERIIMGGLESVSLDTFDKDLAYVALGHIHRAQQLGDRENIRYSGSPLPMSFSELRYRHQVVYVEIEGEKACKIESILIPRLVNLLAVPEKPCPPEEVIEALEALPEKTKKGGLPPFLEVRVLLLEPEPSFRHRVEKIVENKQIRLTSIVPSYSIKETENGEFISTYHNLQKIDPVNMLKQAFTTKYHVEMPDELQRLFRKVIEELNAKSEIL